MILAWDKGTLSLIIYILMTLHYCIVSVLKIRTIRYAQDLWTLARPCKHLRLLSPPNPWNSPCTVILTRVWSAHAKEQRTQPNGAQIIAFCQDRLWTAFVITNRDFYEYEFYLLARMIFKINYRFCIYSHFCIWELGGFRGTGAGLVNFSTEPSPLIPEVW